MNSSTINKIQLAICEHVSAARKIITELKEAGFTEKEVSLLCSNETFEREFSEFVDEHPGEEKRNRALNTTAIAALGLGTAAAVTGLLTTTGIAIVAIGAFYGIAITGTLASVLVTRGAEGELADYYEQALGTGKFLIAVETDQPDLQKVADKILTKNSERTSTLDN